MTIYTKAFITSLAIMIFIPKVANAVCLQSFVKEKSTVVDVGSLDTFFEVPENWVHFYREGKILELDIPMETSAGVRCVRLSLRKKKQRAGDPKTLSGVVSIAGMQSEFAAPGNENKKEDGTVWIRKDLKSSSILRAFKAAYHLSFQTRAVDVVFFNPGTDNSEEVIVCNVGKWWRFDIGKKCKIIWGLGDVVVSGPDKGQPFSQILETHGDLARVLRGLVVVDENKVTVRKEMNTGESVARSIGKFMVSVPRSYFSGFGVPSGKPFSDRRIFLGLGYKVAEGEISNSNETNKGIIIVTHNGDATQLSYPQDVATLKDKIYVGIMLGSTATDPYSSSGEDGAGFACERDNFSAKSPMVLRRCSGGFYLDNSVGVWMTASLLEEEEISINRIGDDVREFLNKVVTAKQEETNLRAN